MPVQPLRKYLPLGGGLFIDSAEIADNSILPADVLDPIAEGGAAGIGLKIARVQYNFADDGGAIGAINLFAATSIPADALVVGVVANVLVTFTTAGADAGTVAFGVEAAADLIAAIAVADASNPWDAGIHQYWGAVAEAAVPLTTVARDVIFTIGGQVVTAGQADFYLFYIETA